ncbi:hypothetical protein KM043_003565 [Ampulex compressa]|nr:hypothetical protein KM043_003565 [Ampulex compressa]
MNKEPTKLSQTQRGGHSNAIAHHQRITLPFPSTASRIRLDFLQAYLSFALFLPGPEKPADPHGTFTLRARADDNSSVTAGWAEIPVTSSQFTGTSPGIDSASALEAFLLREGTPAIFTMAEQNFFWFEPIPRGVAVFIFATSQRQRGEC